MSGKSAAHALPRLLRLALLLLVTGVSLLLPAAVTPADTETVYVSDGRQSISCLQLDPAQGTLRLLSTSSGGTAPSFLAWNLQHTVIYAVNEWDPQGGCVRAFRRSPENGALTLIGAVACGGKGPCHLTVHPSGRWLLVANYGSGQIGVLPIHDDGSLGDPVASVHPGEHAHMTLCDPSGAFVFVPCLGSDHIAQYRFDASTGQLTPNQPAWIDTLAGAGPRYLVMRDTVVYAVNEKSSSIATYAYEAASGTLSSKGPPQSLLPAGFTGTNTGGHLAIAPSGLFVYASNRGHNSIAIFSRDPVTGALTLVGHETGGGEIRTPRCFTIDPSGSLALVASQDADLVTVFRVDPVHGTWSRIGSTPVTKGPTFVGIMPTP